MGLAMTVYLPVKIESMDQEGRGIAHADGKVIFINGALVGELVTYPNFHSSVAFVPEAARCGAPATTTAQSENS